MFLHFQREDGAPFIHFATAHPLQSKQFSNPCRTMPPVFQMHRCIEADIRAICDIGNSSKAIDRQGFRLLVCSNLFWWIVCDNLSLILSLILSNIVSKWFLYVSSCMMMVMAAALFMQSVPPRRCFLFKQILQQQECGQQVRWWRSWFCTQQLLPYQWWDFDSRGSVKNLACVAWRKK